ncbi:MAG: LLM class F420-dependent oxidoreductase [Pseudomonadota bacterium]
MNFGLLFANTGPYVEPTGAALIARTAEDTGFESLWTVEHVAVPADYQSSYPYHESGKMPGTEDAPIPDPLIWLSYVAAVTERIRLATGILILPQRHPIYVAKEVATLDVLSSGRVTLGVGIGWLAEEFEALGIPFRERAARTEECIEAMRSLWAGGASAFDGEFYRWSALESNPKPAQGTHVPIVIGGHVPAAARRAARYGDGFFPALADIGELQTLFDVIRRECEATQRDPSEVELSVLARIRRPEDIEPYAALGVSRIVAPIPTRSDAELKERLAQYADEVIRPLNG